MRKYIRRNTPNLLLLILLLVLIGVAVWKDFINVNELGNERHIDLLTINSIFIGFLFTTLGVIVGFLGNTKIANSDRAGYMDEYYNTIYYGLFFFVISAVCGLLALFVEKIASLPKIFFIEQVTIIIGVAFFIKAIINLSTIIKKVRKSL